LGFLAFDPIQDFTSRGPGGAPGPARGFRPGCNNDKARQKTTTRSAFQNRVATENNVTNPFWNAERVIVFWLLAIFSKGDCSISAIKIIQK